ncbi:MAG: NADPH-dependent 7-cyano-7-deazaguanine reductase QueF [Elusimicrobia bacterium]|nr:NADPH-dependent 7-cyano-7-deazaguanine reductase QueF [Elusimicrobiota bacterium]
MKKKGSTYGYGTKQAVSGTKAALPAIEAWPNQYRGYEIRIEDAEFTCVCPKTGLPDFGTVTLRYQPAASCVELKSYKYYMLAFRNLGIFNENVVNRVLDDVVAAVRPVWAEVEGAFTSRGGMRSTVTARYPRGRSGARP